jgi:hypothetical protein
MTVAVSADQRDDAERYVIDALEQEGISRLAKVTGVTAL